KILVDRRDLRFVGASPAGTRARPLFFHFGLKACMIDGQATLASHFLLLIERQAEGVVELERGRARQLTAGSRLRFINKHFLRNLERGRIAMLFVLHYTRNALDAFE